MAEKKSLTIALAGNPNSGKTTVFNLITLTDIQTGTLTTELEHLPRPGAQGDEEKQP